MTLKWGVVFIELYYILLKLQNDTQQNMVKCGASTRCMDFTNFISTEHVDTYMALIFCMYLTFLIQVEHSFVHSFRQ